MMSFDRECISCPSIQIVVHVLLSEIWIAIISPHPASLILVPSTRTPRKNELEKIKGIEPRNLIKIHTFNQPISSSSSSNSNSNINNNKVTAERLCVSCDDAKRPTRLEPHNTREALDRIEPVSSVPDFTGFLPSFIGLCGVSVSLGPDWDFFDTQSRPMKDRTEPVTGFID